MRGALGFTNKLRTFFTNEEKHCYNCEYAEGILGRSHAEKNRTKYEKYKNDSDYIDVQFDSHSGGVKATHIGHIDHESDKEKLHFGKFIGSQLESMCQDQLFRLGHSAILCDESKRKKGSRLTSLDLCLDGVMMDIKSITQKPAYTLALFDKNEQLRKYNSREDINTPADTVCLYFYDTSLYKKSNMNEAISRYKKQAFILVIKRVLNYTLNVSFA